MAIGFLGVPDGPWAAAVGRIHVSRITPAAPDERFLQGHEKGLPQGDYERQIEQAARYVRVVSLRQVTECRLAETI
jgi:hypothetical protein